MTETAQSSEYTLERASIKPFVDAVHDFNPQPATTWSEVASQCWSSDTKTSSSAFEDVCKKTFGYAAIEAGRELENRGVIPGTRINLPVTDPEGFVVNWGQTGKLSDATNNAQSLAPSQSFAPNKVPSMTPPRPIAPNGEQALPTRPALPFSPDSNTEGGQKNGLLVLPEISKIPRTGQRRSGPNDQSQFAPDKSQAAPDQTQLAPADRISPPSRRDVNTVPTQSGERGNVYELKLENNTGNHRVDASVIVPKGYDPNQPTRLLIYNHGFRTDAHAALNYSQLPQQMQSADSQTVMVIPEWQASPGSNSSSRGRSDQPNFYRNMLNEIMQKTPELSGLNVDRLSSIGIIAHSAGYNPAIAQLYKNGLSDKISSVTVLDSMYNPSAYDSWITHNLSDIAAGRKQFQLIYTGHLSGQSRALQSRIAQQLNRAGLGTDSMYDDRGSSTGLVSEEAMASRGFVFKRSDFTTRGDGAHGAMTMAYVRQLVNSERMRA